MIKKVASKLLNTLGYKLLPIKLLKTIDSDIVDDKVFQEIFHKCKPFTATSSERMYSLFQAVNYVIQHNIEGDFVECGVWRGGSSMLMAHALLYQNVQDRPIHLYDTFEGMSAPTEFDVTFGDKKAEDGWQGEYQYKAEEEGVWQNMRSTKYPENMINFVRGKVEDTIPKNMPEKIALLRLDTDWYESTYHELTYLFPLLSKNGVLIIDDYGHWKGARKAVDQYFGENNIQIFLNRIDYTGRIAIKQ